MADPQRDAALQAAAQAVDDYWRFDEPLLDAFERAILAAEERGRRAGMEQAAKIADRYPAENGTFIAAAIRAMAPCEHGDRDWETCPKCRGWET